MKRISSTFTKPLSTLNFKRFHQLFFCTLPYITSIKIGERFIAEVFLRKETAANAALFSFSSLRDTFFYEKFSLAHLITKTIMRSFLPFSFLLALSCADFLNTNSIQSTSSPIQQIQSAGKKYPINSWQYFLQHLPLVDSPIRDYKGKLIADQKKHIAIIPYDVGKADLQQCADALIRLRAEYLFQQKKYNDIGFHFVSGQYYTWNEYCNGLHVVAKGNNVTFIRSSTSEKTHVSLRNYLDIVYAYSSTISLAKELKFASNFEVGTIVIHPGSPGHCFNLSSV